MHDLPKCYNPGRNKTVDAQLVGFRGRCPFKQYIPSKFGKYGIKVSALCDVTKRYVGNMHIRKNCQEKSQKKNQRYRVVSDLAQNF